MDSDANIQVEGNASVSVQAQSEQPSSNLAAKRNFSWRPKEVPSNPPTLNKKYTEGQGWELLPCSLKKLQCQVTFGSVDSR